MGAAASVKCESEPSEPHSTQCCARGKQGSAAPQRSRRVISLDDQVVRSAAETLGAQGARPAERVQRSTRVTSLDVDVLGAQVDIDFSDDGPMMNPDFPVFSLPPSPKWQPANISEQTRQS